MMWCSSTIDDKGEFKMLRKTVVVITLALAVCAGCQSHAQSKEAARQRWSKASAPMKLALAKQQIETGDYEKAAATVQQCLTADADNPQVRLLFGRLLLVQGRLDEAVEQLNIALKSNERLHQGWYWLGVAAQEDRDYKKAYKYYDKALSLEPANVDYILAVADAQVALQKYSQAVELLTEKMKACSGNAPLKIAAADLMLRQGDIQRAIKLYEQAVFLTDDSDAAESLGYCYMLDGRWQMAAEVFERLSADCKDEQKSKLLLRLLAICNMNASQYGKAVNYYDKLSVEQRNNAEIWLKMGQAALGAGAVNRAFMCGQKAVALQPGYADAIALIGCAQYMADDYAAAIASFEEIAADSKNIGFSWLMRARCYEQLGQANKAEWAYKKASEMNPRSELSAYLVNHPR
jgi:tetratricopeptide (TPR) repeat protein